MSTITTIASGDLLETTSRTTINTNFENLNTDKLQVGGAQGTPVRGDLLIATTATPTWNKVVLGASGKILRSDGTDLLYSGFTIPNTMAVSTLLYASSLDTLAALATANSGVLVTSGTGVPSIATDIPTAVTIGTAYIYRVGGTDVAITDGGTGASVAATALSNLGGIGAATTDTLTNKRYQPRSNTTTSTATLTPALATANVWQLTAQAVNLTIAAPTGTPVLGEVIVLLIKDNGTSRTLTWNATYKAMDAALPTATTINKRTEVIAQYDGTDWLTSTTKEQ